MTALRRVISIIMYLVAGMFLMTWAAMSFVASEPDLSKEAMMGVMAIFALLPLAVGAALSPGRRGREVGIVLLVAAGWAAFTAAALGMVMMDSWFMAMMPPETQQSFTMFNDVAFGSAVTLVMAAVGLWLVRRGAAISANDAD